MREELLVTRDLKEIRDHSAFLAPEETMDLLDFLGWKDHRDPKELLAMTDPKAKRVPRGLPGPLVHPRSNQ